MTTKTVSITPAQATAWLEVNLHNRKLNRQDVLRHADAIRSGLWALNGEAVKIGKSGNVLDGQHRLAGCVLADKPFTTLIVYDVDDTVFSTLDSGRTRSVRDTLDIASEADGQRLGAALSALTKYEDGSIGGSSRFMAQTSLIQLGRHPAMRDSVAKTKSHPTHIASRYLTVAHYLGCLVDREKTELFVSKLKSGENMLAGDPALLLRNRLLGGTIPTSGAQREVQCMALFVKALNHALGNKSLKLLKYSTSQEFPSVVGFPYGRPIAA